MSFLLFIVLAWLLFGFFGVIICALNDTTPVDPNEKEIFLCILGGFIFFVWVIGQLIDENKFRGPLARLYCYLKSKK